MSELDPKTKKIILGVAAGVAVFGLGYYLLSRRNVEEELDIDGVTRQRGSQPPFSTSAASGAGAPVSTPSTPTPAGEEAPVAAANAASEPAGSADAPATHSDYKRKGNSFYTKKNYEEAIEMYTKAIEACPPDLKGDIAVYYANRAAAYVCQKRYPEALQDCNAALEREPQYPKALHRRGTILEKEGRVDDALADYAFATLLERLTNKKYQQAYTELLDRLGTQKAASLKQTLDYPIPPSRTLVAQFVASYYSEDSTEGSLTAPGEQASGDDWYLHSQALIRAEEYAAAWAALQKSFTCSPPPETHRAAALRMKGNFLAMQGGHEEEALAEYARALELEIPRAGRVETILRMGHVLLEQQKLDAAEAKAEEARKVDADDPNVHFLLGQIKMQRQVFADAIGHFKKASELQPKFEHALIQLGVVQFQAAQAVTGIATLKDVTKRFPNSSMARNFLGELLLAQKKFVESQVEFEAAKELNPKCPLAYVNLGVLLFHLKPNELEISLGHLRKAIELDPLFSVAHSHLGNVLMQRMDSGCLASLERAIKLSRSDLELQIAIQCYEAARVHMLFCEKFPEVAKALDKDQQAAVGGS